MMWLLKYLLRMEVLQVSFVWCSGWMEIALIRLSVVELVGWVLLNVLTTQAPAIIIIRQWSHCQSIKCWSLHAVAATTAQTQHVCSYW